jgi:3-(3-hydroxy-phenyl)propionate hydroxylase
MSETDGATERRVIIAGAGPVGMTTALALDARGVPATILEADPEDRDREGSRANYVHGATLEILETAHPGLGKRIADTGIIWPTRRTLWKGKEVFSRTYSDPGGSGDLPHFTSLRQTTVEDYMHEAIQERDIDLHWDSAVESVEVVDDGVVVETEDGQQWEGAYAVGADGAGSTVRKEIGVEFEGTESDNPFVIFDVEEFDEDPLPKERIFHYHHPDVDGRNVMLVPFNGGWRVDITCRIDDDPEYLSSDEKLEDLVVATMGERYADRVSWVSTYRFKQVLADSFIDADRRVLLAGEAAHLFAPFGGRGMNSGIADADIAASALSAAVDAEVDEAAEREIENYAAIRETAADWNRHAAGKALEHLSGDDPITELKKRGAARVADWYEPAGKWLDEAPFGPLSGPPIPNKGKY